MKESEKKGIKINFKKSEYMVVRTRKTQKCKSQIGVAKI